MGTGLPLWLMQMSGHQAKVGRTSLSALLPPLVHVAPLQSVSVAAAAAVAVAVLVLSLVRASPQQPAPAQLDQSCRRGNSTHFHVLLCFTQVALKRRRTLRVTSALAPQ